MGTCSGPSTAEHKLLEGSRLRDRRGQPPQTRARRWSDTRARLHRNRGCVWATWKTWRLRQTSTSAWWYCA